MKKYLIIICDHLDFIWAMNCSCTLQFMMCMLRVFTDRGHLNNHFHTIFPIYFWATSHSVCKLITLRRWCYPFMEKYHTTVWIIIMVDLGEELCISSSFTCGIDNVVISNSREVVEKCDELWDASLRFVKRVCLRKWYNCSFSRLGNCARALLRIKLV